MKTKSTAANLTTLVHTMEIFKTNNTATATIQKSLTKEFCNEY